MKALLSQCFDDSVQQAPDRPAFIYGNKKLTYGELDALSRKLAGLLVAHGVRKGDRVGIYAQRSLESAIAVYGIMRAGAAYVPIDPFSPNEAVERNVRHCGIQVLVTHQPMKRWVNRFLELSECPISLVVGLENSDECAFRCISWQSIKASESAYESLPVLKAMDLAYIMYTSGSTGNPKGIMHTHYSGINYARLSANKYELSSHDRIGSHSPLHFDMSTFGYFTGPYAGATTVLIPEAHTKLPASLAKLIEDSGITVWYSVPYALIQLLNHGGLEGRKLDKLRWILYGGEPFSRRSLYALMEVIPHVRVANVYGPAEVNQCTHYEILAPSEKMTEAELAKPFPLGSIWEETKGLILDPNDKPVLRGEIGELMIRSTTMMKGYWKREDLNDKAFYHLKDGTCSQAYYRTGDLVRVDTKGQLEFVGRKDRQIKLRGFRIELDEIENQLSALPGVVESAVYLTTNSTGEKVIEGAVIQQADQSFEVKDIRNQLSEYLVSYLIPDSIIFVDDFPRTATGKIDRRKLKQIADDQLETVAGLKATNAGG